MPICYIIVPSYVQNYINLYHHSPNIISIVPSYAQYYVNWFIKYQQENTECYMKQNFLFGSELWRVKEHIRHIQEEAKM